MSEPKHLLFLLTHFFWGFFLSLLYGVITSYIIFKISPIEDFKAYHHAYFLSFNCLISGGLIIGATILIYCTQSTIPNLIEDIFDEKVLSRTDYFSQKKVFNKISNTIVFSTEFILIGFIVFYFARFPLDGIGLNFMIVYGCIQYALGVYIGRKIFYIAQMLNSIEKIEVNSNIFSGDKLGTIATYVNAVSTITIIFVYVHVSSYYNAPFVYDTLLQSSIKIALLIPAVIAVPVVVVFNFYPRTILKKIYEKSISKEIDRLTINLRNNNLSPFERMSYIIQYDKLSKEELRYRLRVTLTDLPIGITILMMVAKLIQ